MCDLYRLPAECDNRGPLQVRQYVDGSQLVSGGNGAHVYICKSDMFDVLCLMSLVPELLRLCGVFALCSFCRVCVCIMAV